MPNQYWVSRGEVIRGPYSDLRIRGAVKDGKLLLSDMASTGSSSGPWFPLADLLPVDYGDQRETAAPQPAVVLVAPTDASAAAPPLEIAGAFGNTSKVPLATHAAAEIERESRKYFCRVCGKEVNPASVACLTCGVPPGGGDAYCHRCGNATHSEAIICVKCGCSLKPTPTTSSIWRTGCATSVPATDLEAAVSGLRTSEARKTFYRKAFAEIQNKGGQFTPIWNTHAALLCPLMYLYAGIYAKGAAFLVANLVLTSMLGWLALPATIIFFGFMFTYDLYLKEVYGKDFY